MLKVKVILATIAIVLAIPTNVLAQDKEPTEPTDPVEVYSFVEAAAGAGGLNDWGSSVEVREDNGIDEYYEDGSWTYNEYKGCVRYEACDEYQPKRIYCDRTYESPWMGYTVIQRFCSLNRSDSGSVYYLYFMGRDGSEIVLTQLLMPAVVLEPAPYTIYLPMIFN